MVTTACPSAAETGVTQPRTAVPPTWMVQAPQRACPQPNLVPVSPTSSRRYHSSGMSGSPSKLRSAPFTVSLIIGVSCHGSGHGPVGIGVTPIRQPSGSRRGHMSGVEGVEPPPGRVLRCGGGSGLSDRESRRSARSPHAPHLGMNPIKRRACCSATGGRPRHPSPERRSGLHVPLRTGRYRAGDPDGSGRALFCRLSHDSHPWRAAGSAFALRSRPGRRSTRSRSESPGPVRQGEVFRRAHLDQAGDRAVELEGLAPLGGGVEVLRLGRRRGDELHVARRRACPPG